MSELQDRIEDVLERTESVQERAEGVPGVNSNFLDALSEDTQDVRDAMSEAEESGLDFGDDDGFVALVLNPVLDTIEMRLTAVERTLSEEEDVSDSTHSDE